MTPVLALLLAAAAGPVARTDSGMLRGERGADGRAVFRGVPFAKAPVGPLRWRPPRPVARWRGVRDARGSAPSCPQNDLGWNSADAAVQAEDCLYLEVATPSLAPHEPLPVMVWVHGGGNRAGRGAGTTGSSIVRRGVVLVSIQYRLGALGFLSHPALSAEGRGASGNYGLMDQQAALRWVRRNIARFGGNPDNVTIFAESAGGQDVGLHLLSPGSRGLFARAIEESGTAGFGVPPRGLAQNEALGVAIARAAGARDDTSAALRRLPVAALLRAGEPAEVRDLRDASFVWLQAVVDGAVLRETPAALLARGEVARVPLIVGSNAREFSAFGGTAEAGRTVDEMWPGRAREARAIYGLVVGPRAAVDPRRGDVGMQVSTDAFFACPAVTVARAMTRAGAPVWRYEFDQDMQGARPVAHASEIPFVFAPSPAEARAAPLQDYWVTFARTGDPNASGLPAWPRFDERERLLRFAPEGPRVEARLRTATCDLRNAP